MHGDIKLVIELLEELKFEMAQVREDLAQCREDLRSLLTEEGNL